MSTTYGANERLVPYLAAYVCYDGREWVTYYVQEWAIAYD